MSTSTRHLLALALLGTSAISGIAAIEHSVVLCNRGVNGVIKILDYGQTPPVVQDISTVTAQNLYKASATPIDDTPTGYAYCAYTWETVYPPGVQPRAIITGGHETLPDYLKDPTGPGGYLQSNHNSPSAVYVRLSVPWSGALNYTIYAYSDFVGNYMPCAMTYASTDLAAYDGAKLEFDC